MTLAQPGPAPLSSHQILESDNESDSSGLDLVNLAQCHPAQANLHWDNLH